MFGNNVTFAIISAEETWRTDLTLRFAEYFSKKINGPLYKQNIIVCKTPDEAYEKSRTDFICIQFAGHIIFDYSFFNSAELFFKENKSLFLAKIELVDDYAVFSKTCFFINKLIWESKGKPTFKSSIKSSQIFNIKEKGKLKNYPNELGMGIRDKVIVSEFCAENGAQFIDTQFELFQTVVSSVSVIPENSHFFISKTTPYEEVFTETYFEKNYLAKLKYDVFTVDNDSYAEITDISADTVVTTCQGLKAYDLVKYCKSSKLVIYDTNALALEFQKRIFSITSPTLYGDLVKSFIKEFPDANIVGHWKTDEFTVLQPIPVKSEFVLIDVFSYEVIDLICNVDNHESAVFDFADIFVYPFNYYKRPLYQIQSLFSEVYSLIKSRSGPSYILGFAPGFQNMNSIKVNTVDFTATSTLEKYNFEKSVEYKEMLKQKMFVHPKLNIVKEEKVEIKQVEQTEDPVNVNLVFVTDTAKQQEYDIQYEQDKICLKKKVEFPEFIGMYEYEYHTKTQKWNFKVYKVDSDKKIEICNGTESGGLVRHLNLPSKINPRAIIRQL